MMNVAGAAPEPHTFDGDKQLDYDLANGKCAIPQLAADNCSVKGRASTGKLLYYSIPTCKKSAAIII
jgi:hypothetical protein